MHKESGGRAQTMLIAGVMVAGLAFAGCVVDDPDRPEPEGQVALYVKDAPADVEAMWVTFTELRAVTPADLRGELDVVQEDGQDPTVDRNESAEQDQAAEQEGSTLQNETDGENETTGPEETRNTTGEVGGARFHTIADPLERIDLVEQRGEGRAALAGQGTLAPGTYEHILLRMEGGEARLADGTTAAVDIVHEYVILSGAFTVEDGRMLQILVDFDLEGSLEEGDGGDLTFLPTIQELNFADRAGTRADLRSFAFDDAERRDDVAILTAWDTRIETGALLLSLPRVDRPAEVTVDLLVDSSGDGSPDQQVSGALPETLGGDRDVREVPDRPRNDPETRDGQRGGTSAADRGGDLY